MADFAITLDNASLRALTAKLGAATAQATLEPPMARSLARIQHDLQVYPPPARKAQPFKSDKQRRFVFAAIARGEIPYKRTGNLGRTWHTATIASSGGLLGTVGNATSYAGLVQGKGRQAAYHQGIWGTDQEALERHRVAITRDFLTAIEKALAS